MDNNAGVRRVGSAGLALAVRERSAWAPGKQSVILVHGYPDQQDMWDLVVAALDHERLHIVTYDVRGAGASEAPADTAGYRTELLVDDLVAVAGATVPDAERFHLVGHDWGSVQLWDVVAAEPADPRLHGRVASFTSVSGPSLDHIGWLSRNREGRRLRLLNQSAHSWYVYLFHVPLVPELAWSAAGWVGSRTKSAHKRHWAPSVARNARNGLNLYRANILRRMREPRALRTDIPVQVVHPTRDRFLTDVTLEGLHHACSNLSVVRVDAGHWLPRSHPGELGQLISDHVHAP